MRLPWFPLDGEYFRFSGAATVGTLNDSFRELDGDGTGLLHAGYGYSIDGSTECFCHLSVLGLGRSRYDEIACFEAGDRLREDHIKLKWTIDYWLGWPKYIEAEVRRRS